MRDVATSEVTESNANLAGLVGHDGADSRAPSATTEPSAEIVEVLSLIAAGKISLMRATELLRLPDAGHLLSLMRKHGTRPYRRPRADVLARATSDAQGSG